MIVLNGEQIRIVTPEGAAITMPQERALELFFCNDFRDSVGEAMKQFDKRTKWE